MRIFHIPRPLRLEAAHLWLLQISGGPARLRVIVMLAGVMAMNGADMSTVGAVAPLLENAFRISYAQVGLLVTASQLVGALAALPVGLLSDRSRRVRLLWISIVFWGVAMVAAGISQSYLWLLFSRIGLGAVSATSGPTLVSLTGDFFSGRERARIYGYILGGDLVGSGFGLLIAGNVAAAFTWRWAFWLLAVPALLLAYAIYRWLPEPARGGQSHLQPGAEEIPSTEDVGDQQPTATSERALGRDVKVERAVRRAGARPYPELVLHQDPGPMPFWKAARYVLAVRTNLILIVASAIGYFFLAGVRTFAVIFFRSQYHISESAATLVLAAVALGGLVGVLVAGGYADRRLGRRHPSARIEVSSAGYVLAAAAFVPALLIPTLSIAAPFYFIAAAGLGGLNPPSDAARLDVMHFRLWGRASSVRQLLRNSLEAAAPFLFGVVADFLAGGGVSAYQRATSASSGRGLELAFLLFLIPLLAAGVIPWLARRRYQRDVATALASERATAPSQEEHPDRTPGSSGSTPSAAGSPSGRR